MGKTNSNSDQNPQVQADNHWADEIATRIIRQKPNQDLFTLAAGITPSGTVHVGNFREVFTVDLVKRALERKGKKVRFVFSWDDYDVFRKVPENMPNKEKLKTFLGKSISQIPDPHGEYDTYAQYHEKNFEHSLEPVGIFPEFLYQSQKYQNLEYVEGMRRALECKEKIKDILNQFREEPLEEDWLPISIFCNQCGDNKMKTIKQVGDTIEYTCSQCENYEEVDLKQARNIKLLWRIDWPMRWHHERLDFEPGGKDHSSEGGSYDTAKMICQDVYNFPPPIYAPYNFVSIKGKGGKMSSSSGDVITLKDVLEIYEPEIVRWIFTSYRNNSEFSISFDLDVIKNYEAFDRLERIYYDLEESSPKQREKLKRIYELSQVDSKKIRDRIIYRPSFRHLTNIIQIYNFDQEKIEENYKKHLETELDLQKFRERLICASNWIKKYAPEEFTFSLNNQKKHQILENYEEKYQNAIKDFGFFIRNDFFNLEEKEVSEYIYSLIEKHNLDLKLFYEIIYLLLINKKNGPKLVNFLKIINQDKLTFLIEY